MIPCMNATVCYNIIDGILVPDDSPNLKITFVLVRLFLTRKSLVKNLHSGLHFEISEDPDQPLQSDQICSSLTYVIQATCIVLKINNRRYTTWLRELQ